MTEEATHEEEEVVEETEDSPKGVSRRDAAMDDIIARRDAEEGFTEEEEEEEVEDPPAKPEPQPEDSMTFIGADGVEYRVPKSARAKFKIDGQEVEEELSKTISNYQKGVAGDKRLQEAHEAWRRIEAEKGELSKREKAYQEAMRSASQQKAKGNLSQDDYDEAVGKAVAALVDANEDDAKAALKEIISSFQTPGSGLTDEQLEEKLRQRELSKAIKRFNRDYKNLAENQEYFNRVDAKTAELSADDPDAAPWDIIKKAADIVNDEVKQEREQQVNTTLRERLAEAGLSEDQIKIILAGEKLPEKKKAPKKKALPTPVSGRASIGHDEKEETKEDVIAEMKAARGQPV